MLQIDKILYFWFGPPGQDEQRKPQWFEQDDAFDHAIREQFLDDVEAALTGELDAFARTPEAYLALIILLDQFPRNLYRGAAKAFAGDERALNLTTAAVGKGHDQSLGPIKRVFMYLPFQHAESLADQETSVALYKSLGDESSTDFAIRHRDTIERFGRFPARNRALGRESTPEEIAFLKDHEMGF